MEGDLAGARVGGVQADDERGQGFRLDDVDDPQEAYRGSDWISAIGSTKEVSLAAQEEQRRHTGQKPGRGENREPGEKPGPGGKRATGEKTMPSVQSKTFPSLEPRHADRPLTGGSTVNRRRSEQACAPLRSAVDEGGGLWG